MIKRLTVKKLHGHTDFDLCFHPDMNVLTGRNGCGKTTLLKLAWYMISGNLDRVMSEITFDAATVETDAYILSVLVNRSKREEGTATWKFIDSEGNSEQYPNFKALLDGLPAEVSMYELKRRLVEAPGASLFFPTFRRIEGGFAMSRPEKPFGHDSAYSATVTKVEEAMRELSEFLSAAGHRFIASLSTQDVIGILTDFYTETLERVNQENFVLSQKITSALSQYTPLEGARKDSATSDQLTETLNQIQKLVSDNTSHQSHLLQPLTALTELISQLFQHKGINIAPGINFGEIKDAISSEFLSAGEKQMLGFVVYNAFMKNQTFFIDEPEISLHVDWQRILFSVLESQGTNNQFIIATHSPFIYSKYTDKEIALNPDRGE